MNATKQTAPEKLRPRREAKMHATKHTLPKKTRSKLVKLLQSSLVDAIDLASHAKQAHWNVKGANFIALHELFDQVHADLGGFADLLAERLVILGGQAHGTVREAACASSLAEYPVSASSGAEHVDALSTSLATYGTSLRDAIDAADKLGDQNTADLFTEVSRGIDKLLWFVESHA